MFSYPGPRGLLIVLLHAAEIFVKTNGSAGFGFEQSTSNCFVCVYETTIGDLGVKTLKLG